MPKASSSQPATCAPTGPPSQPSHNTVARTSPDATSPSPQSSGWWWPRVFLVLLRTRAGLRGLRVRAGAARFFRVAMGLLLLRGVVVSCAVASPFVVVSVVVSVAGIAVAGAFGALARYGLEGVVSRRWPGAFPWGTFVVNITGAFAIGLLFVLLTERVSVDPWVRSSITIGFLGAYTTFSTLSFESYRLLEDGAIGLALVNTLGSVAAGLVAVYLGVAAGRAI